MGLWDVATGKQSVTFTGHGKAVGGVAVSPDGRLLATASGDFNCAFLGCGHRRGVAKPPRAHGVGRYHRVLPDGTLLASAGQSGNDVRIWGLAGGNGVTKATQPPDPRATPVPLSPSAITSANAAQLERRALPTSSPYRECWNSHRTASNS